LRRLALCLSALLLGASPEPAAAQETPSAPSSVEVKEGPAPSPIPAEYQVGAGDVLEVSVIGNDDLSRVATVQPTGAVNLPLLGQVPVATLTTAEIVRKLTALLARDYLVDPQVEVRVKEYQSQFVTVVGEVNQPGRRPLRGRTRLFDILVEAGGFTPRSSGEVTVTRRNGSFEGGGQALRLRFGSSNPSAADLLNLEILLVNGDLVAALPKRFITVEGEVQRPARYPLELDFTLSQAILGAGGLTRYGKNDVKIRRTDPVSGTVTFVEVDLKAIRDGRDKDPVLLPDDVVLVSRRTF